MKRYGAIYADPAWSFKVWSAETGQGRSAESHYDTMSLADMKALPVSDMADDNCALFMWAVMPQLPEAFELMSAWGFTYKTCAFTWMKQNLAHGTRPAPASNPHDLFTGMGYWTRANAELCLLGVKGKPHRQSKAVQQAILEPRREHSRKPDCVYTRIEQLVPGPYIEMFARTKRPGWDVWGNQTDKFEYREGILG